MARDETTSKATPAKSGIELPAPTSAPFVCAFGVTLIFAGIVTNWSVSIIGFILGPSAEVYFVKSLESFGDLTVFFTKSWIAMVLWVLIIGSLAASVYLARNKCVTEQSV